MTSKGALSTAATRLMDSLCEGEIHGAHKKSVYGGTGGGNRLVYKGRDDYFFTYLRFYTVIISDGRNNWQKKNDLFSELASGKKDMADSKDII